MAQAAAASRRQPNVLPLQDRAILVTGGSRGIGAAIVKELCEQGARVLFTYASRHEAAQAVVKPLKDTGHNVLGTQADVRDLKQMQDVVQQSLDTFGRLDGLVNNAGITRDKALMMMSPEDWQEVLDTNLTGTFNACRAAIVAFMKQKSGRIVNMSSVSGLTGLSRQVNYSASKAGVIGLTKALAKEVAGYGITVNAVAPGYIATDMTAALDDKRRVDLEQQIPLRRFGRPEEVATLVAMLFGNAGAYITGQVFVIDGGLAI